MITVEEARRLALSFSQTEEHDHWGRPSFRVKKKIFLTLWLVEKLAVLKLSPIDQSVFCEHSSNFYPVKGSWGKKGWTYVELKNVRKDMFKDALHLSWREVAPKSLLKM